MKLWRAVQLFAVLAAAALFVRNLPDLLGERAWDTLSLPYRMARLMARPADQALGMPVQGVHAARVADTWHAPRAPRRQHEGQDIFARRGTPVLSATDGVVVNVGDNHLGGHTVTVPGAGGTRYYYAHLDRWAEGLAFGQPVQTGDVLGYVGTTGNAQGTPPHLHFGVYGPAGALNPLPLLARGEAAERQIGGGAVHQVARQAIRMNPKRVLSRRFRQARGRHPDLIDNSPNTGGE